MEDQLFLSLSGWENLITPINAISGCNYTLDMTVIPHGASETLMYPVKWDFWKGHVSCFPLTYGLNAKLG